MDTQDVPYIIGVDRLDNGVVITFDDGRSAFYTAALLLEMFPQAEEMKQKAALQGMIDIPESA